MLARVQIDRNFPEGRLPDGYHVYCSRCSFFRYALTWREAQTIRAKHEEVHPK